MSLLSVLRIQILYMGLMHVRPPLRHKPLVWVTVKAQTQTTAGETAGLAPPGTCVFPASQPALLEAQSILPSSGVSVTAQVFLLTLSCVLLAVSFACFFPPGSN